MTNYKYLIVGGGRPLPRSQKGSAALIQRDQLASSVPMLILLTIARLLQKDYGKANRWNQSGGRLKNFPFHSISGRVSRRLTHRKSRPLIRKWRAIRGRK